MYLYSVGQEVVVVGWATFVGTIIKQTENAHGATAYDVFVPGWNTTWYAVSEKSLSLA